MSCICIPQAWMNFKMPSKHWISHKNRITLNVYSGKRYAWFMWEEFIKHVTKNVSETFNLMPFFKSVCGFCRTLDPFFRAAEIVTKTQLTGLWRQRQTPRRNHTDNTHPAAARGTKTHTLSLHTGLWVWTLPVCRFTFQDLNSCWLSSVMLIRCDGFQ